MTAGGAVLGFEPEMLPHLRLLQRRARRLTGNREDAEDLVQDTLERAYRNFGRFRPGTNMGAWLITILTRLAIDRRRRRAGVAERVSPDEEELALLRQRERGGSAPVSVEERVLDRLDEAAIRGAIDALPPRLRPVLHAYFEQVPRAEVARSLGISAHAVTLRLARSRHRLEHLRRATG